MVALFFLTNWKIWPSVFGIIFKSAIIIFMTIEASRPISQEHRYRLRAQGITNCFFRVQKPKRHTCCTNILVCCYLIHICILLKFVKLGFSEQLKFEMSLDSCRAEYSWQSKRKWTSSSTELSLQNQQVCCSTGRAVGRLYLPVSIHNGCALILNLAMGCWQVVSAGFNS